jgi:hypothetical protein
MTIGRIEGLAIAVALIVVGRLLVALLRHHRDRSHPGR